MKTPLILSFGEVLWDLFPEGPRFGGAPANLACLGALLDCEVAIVSAVGCDTRGASGAALMECDGVRVGLLQHLPDFPTGTVDVLIDAKGEPSYEIRADVAWDHITWTPVLESRLARLGPGDAVYFGTLAQRSETSRATIRRALRQAKSQGVLRVLDVNLRQPFYDAVVIRESMELASVVKLNDAEFTAVMDACGIASGGDIAPEVALRELLARYQLDLVALTLGADGALVVTATETVRQPGFPVVVCDTVGAGDSFTAALVVGLLRGDSLTHIVQVACEISAAVCSLPGAVPSRTFFKAHIRSMSGWWKKN